MTCTTPYLSLVDVKVGLLGVLLPDLLVLSLQSHPQDPRANAHASRKGNASHHGLEVAGSSSLGPQVGGVNTGKVAKGVAHGNRDSLLLIGLTDDRGCPAEDDVVDAVRGTDEEHDAHEANGDVEGRAAHGEANHGNGLAEGDVPGTLVEAAR